MLCGRLIDLEVCMGSVSVSELIEKMKLVNLTPDIDVEEIKKIGRAHV